MNATRIFYCLSCPQRPPFHDKASIGKHLEGHSIDLTQEARGPLNPTRASGKDCTITTAVYVFASDSGYDIRIQLEKITPRVVAIAEKVAHVREKIREGDTAGHKCHWPDCNKEVTPAQWGCKKHWFLLPESLRKRIFGAYRPGQEDDKSPSRRYVEVAREAQIWIKQNYGAVTEQPTLFPVEKGRG